MELEMKKLKFLLVIFVFLSVVDVTKSDDILDKRSALVIVHLKQPSCKICSQMFGFSSSGKRTPASGSSSGGSMPSNKPGVSMSSGVAMSPGGSETPGAGTSSKGAGMSSNGAGMSSNGAGMSSNVAGAGTSSNGAGTGVGAGAGAGADKPGMSPGSMGSVASGSGMTSGGSTSGSTSGSASGSTSSSSGSAGGGQSSGSTSIGGAHIKEICEVPAKISVLVTQLAMIPETDILKISGEDSALAKFVDNIVTLIANDLSSGEKGVVGKISKGIDGVISLAGDPFKLILTPFKDIVYKILHCS